MICWFQYTIIMTRSQYMYRRYVKAERTPPVGARRRRVCRGAGSGRESGGTVAEGRRLACVAEAARVSIVAEAEKTAGQHRIDTQYDVDRAS